MSADWVAGALAVSVVVCVAGTGWRVAGYLRRSRPFPMPTPPAPTTRGALAVRLLREIVLLDTLRRASVWTWALGWTFHLALLLAFLGHLRLLLAPTWPAGVDTTPLATTVGVVLMVTLLGLWLRRLLQPRVRYVSSPSDHAVLALLLVIALSGLVIGAGAGDATDGARAVRAWVVARLRGEAPPLPGGVGVVVHLVGAATLLAILPFGKLVHGPAIVASPTLARRDPARRRR